MPHRFAALLTGLVIVLITPGSARVGGQNLAAPPPAAVDALFSRWSTATPGCAVGVGVGGQAILERAYGMADLEHDVPNAPDTIFEAGSVSKQFTAAAVLLLARETRISLDEPARKYLPELPDYGKPLTIRHMLQHTSGLRDWGNVASITGWPRTTRVHTHAHVLDIVQRQRALNFEPGTDWSYSNTGFNLAAILVSRVAGEPFAEFTRKRIFEPLGMTRTSWRDDYTRIVKGRAVAYSPASSGYVTNMPFENVHGNGGLLTTVSDLLRWNENFVEPRVGGAELVGEQQRSGTLANGSDHGYGLGLYVGRRDGVPEMWHSGSTAGYRAFLARYPDQHLSVAVLCNAANADAGRAAREVADLYLARHAKKAPPPPPATVSAQELDARAGLYKSSKTGEPIAIVRDGDTLRIDGGAVLVPLSDARFRYRDAETVLEFGSSGRAWLRRANGTVDPYERVEPVTPSVVELADFAGTYASDEAEATVTIAVEGTTVMILRRPDTRLRLTPRYRDAFEGSFGIVRFHRNASGRVVQLSIVIDRVWDMRFDRLGADASAP